MPKKLSEVEVLERMRTAQADALTNPNPYRAHEARKRLSVLIRQHPDLAKANNVEPIVMAQTRGESYPLNLYL
jgi:hypothetical protein